MDQIIEAICYDLSVSEEEARLYSFIHQRVVENGGVQQFIQNRSTEMARLREMNPSEINRSVYRILPSEAQQIKQDIPLDTFDSEHCFASYIQSLLAMLEYSASLEARIGVYRDRILPLYDHYTEEKLVETLRKKHQRQQVLRRSINQQVEKLLDNGIIPDEPK